MANSRRVPNINGAANSYLKVASKKDGAASQFSAAAKSAPKAQQQLVQNVLNAVRAAITDSDVYQMDLDSRTADVVLGRIASLLDEVKDKFVATELAEAKEEILEEIRGLSIESILKNFLLSQIAELFDDDAKKEDIEQLKAFIAEKLSSQPNEDSGKNTENDENGEASKEGQTFRDKEVDSLKDETDGDYQDSTIATNFVTMQNFVQQQVDQLNDHIAAIPGGLGLGKLVKFVGTSIGRCVVAVGKLGNKIGKFAKSSLVGIANVSKFLVGGAFKGITKTLGFIKNGIGKVGSLVGKVAGGIGKGFKAIGAGIKGIGSKVGGAILHPFKAIGGFFSRRKKDKIAERKEKMREKFMNFMMNMMEKIWNFVEPILNAVKVFMLIAIVPILTTALTVLAIIAAVTLVVVALVMAYMWGKNKLIPKIKALWDKIVSKLKQWWTITKAWFVGLWEGFKEGLKAIWDGIVYIVSFKWLVDFGKWIWKKLVEFGSWLHKNFLQPYVIEPFKKYIWTPITKIYQKIVNYVKGIVALFKEGKIWQALWKTIKGLLAAYFAIVFWPVTALLAFCKPLRDMVNGWFEKLGALWNDTIKPKILEWWEIAKSFVTGFIEGLKATWETFTNGLRAGIDWIKEKASAIWEFIKELPSKICNLVVSGIKKVIDIGKTIGNFAKEKISPIIEKAATLSFTIPSMSMDWSKWDKWSPLASMKQVFSFGTKEIHPFGFLKGTPADGNVKLEIAGGSAPSEESSSIQQQMPTQQVQNALGPVNSLNNMNADNNVELQKTGEEMSNKAAAAEQATEEYRQQQSLIGSQSLSRLDDLEKKLDKYGNDPAVVPMYIPTGQEQNAMPMKGF